MLVLAKNFLYGEVWWARGRFLVLVSMIVFVSAGLAIAFEHSSLLRVWHNIFYPNIIFSITFLIFLGIVRDLEETSEFESRIGTKVLMLIVFIGILSGFEFALLVHGELPGSFVGHYALALLAAFIGALLGGARYIQDVYDMENYRLALLYLATSLFGFAYPYLSISDGEFQIEKGKTNRLVLLGGPGYISIPPNSAVLIQEQSGSTKVYSGNTFFISRFAKIITVVRLEDQRSTITDVSAITRDGIKITIRDIELRYRIWAGNQLENHPPVKRSHINPYPYSVQAVRDSVFNRSVDANALTPWFDAVKLVVVGKITDFISSHQFDQIVTPNYKEGDPRKQIHDQLFTPEVESRLKDIGVRLLWCDIGHFEEERAALAQHLETWSAKWIGNANVIRAQGEAQRIAYQELGRAEAQADMLKSIIHAFDDVDLSPENKDQNIRNVILMRTAQVLESLIDAREPSRPDKSLISRSADDTSSYKEENSS